MAVVEGFFAEEGYEEEAHGCHHSEEPETPFPFCDVEDECCEEGAEVWGENDKSGPDVDFAAVTLSDKVGIMRRKETYGCSWKKKMSLMNMSPP